MQFISPPSEASSDYDALFEWQTPVALWELSESLLYLMDPETPAPKSVFPYENKKILEAFVMGKTFTLAYHDEICLVRLSPDSAMDGQVYYAGRLQSVEATQALYPGRKRNAASRRAAPGWVQPLTHAERKAYMLYRDAFYEHATRQIEARIEHKFNLYKSLDYLVVHVDLYDPMQPRFSAFALQDFTRECAGELAARLQAQFYTHWHRKINHLFLLDEQPLGGVTRFSPLFLTPRSPTSSHTHDQLSLA